MLWSLTLCIRPKLISIMIVSNLKWTGIEGMFCQHYAYIYNCCTDFPKESLLYKY